jgi:hypothetical protein
MADFHGYHDCPCRDCFETAIGAEPGGGPSLCNACDEAGCSPNGDAECSAPPATECGDCDDTGKTWQDTFSPVHGHYTRDVACSCAAGREYAAGRDEWRADMLENR